MTLPEHHGVSGYTLLWDSAMDDLAGATLEHAPGNEVVIAGASMRLYVSSNVR